jgi:uncharacterized SAM-binding protein YcdF (DUF218 family)
VRPRRKRGCLSVVFFLIVIAVLLAILHAPVFTLAGSALVEDDGAAKADAIVVLGGDGFGNRILRAAELKKSGYAPRVLVSGPVDLLGHESDESIAYAGQKGYPASMFEAVPLPRSITSTRPEVQYLGRLLRDQGVQSIDLVTSNYHTSRAAWLWRKENPGIRVNAVPASDPYFSPETWFNSREGQKTFFLEWAKTLASRLGH